jgi:hypothetical protein
VRQNVLRKLQTARVPDWASVYVGGLRAVGYRCVAMDYHVSSFHHRPLYIRSSLLTSLVGFGKLEIQKPTATRRQFHRFMHHS